MSRQTKAIQNFSINGFFLALTFQITEPVTRVLALFYLSRLLYTMWQWLTATGDTINSDVTDRYCYLTSRDNT